mgnify:FL=1
MQNLLHQMRLRLVWLYIKYGNDKKIKRIKEK